MLKFDAAAARALAEAAANPANPANPSAPISRFSRISRAARLDRFDELAAMLEFDEGASRRDAELRASQALGAADPTVLFAETIMDWRGALIDRRLNREVRAIAGDALAAIDAGWMLRALQAGWRDLELWDVERGLLARLRGAPVVRIDPIIAELSDGRTIPKPMIDGARALTATLFEFARPGSRCSAAGPEDRSDYDGD